MALGNHQQNCFLISNVFQLENLLLFRKFKIITVSTDAIERAAISRTFSYFFSAGLEESKMLVHQNKAVYRIFMITASCISEIRNL